MSTYLAFSKAFEIFHRYSDGFYDHVAVEHDVIYAGPSPDVVSEEDIQTLEELGWSSDDELQCFYYYT